MPAEEDFYTDTAPEYPDEPPTFEADVARLSAQVRVLIKSGALPRQLCEELQQALDNVDAWYETDDPIGNGWIGADGRP